MRKLIFVLCVLAFGCDDPKKEEPKKAISGLIEVGTISVSYDSYAQLSVYHDDNNKVTCYVLVGYDGRGAINCLKDDLATQK